MQCVKVVVSTFGLFGPRVPLCGQLLEVVVDVLFELADVLGAKGVGDGFAFASMLGAVAGVEEAALDGDEAVVVVSVEFSLSGRG